MLNGIISWSLNHRLFVLAAVTLCAGFGAYSLQQLPIDAFPDTTPVQVQINTAAPALTPEEVEAQITRPVEQAISGLAGLESVRSISKFGISQVVVTFKDGTSIYLARQMLLEKLRTVQMPQAIDSPQMGPLTTGLGEVFHYVVRNRGRNDLIELRETQDWDIRPVLRTVPGTAEINSWGGYEKQFQVRIVPEWMLKHDISFDQIVLALKHNNYNVGGGNIDQNGRMLLVQGLGRTDNVTQIGDIVLAAKQGVPIRVRDVAEVAIGHVIRRGAVTADGKGEVVLGLGFMLMGENSNDVTWGLKEELGKLHLHENVETKTLYDRTELVAHVIDTVKKNLLEGGLLVIAVLFIFLGNLRAGLIVASAIPLSMLFAFSGMLRFGIAGSLLSLGAIDFGMIVDSSVVMVENVVRRLSHPRDPNIDQLEVVRDAAIEVRKPTMFGELIIMIVYLPILTLEGMEGKLFRPMALTVIFALLGSMVLSLTLMPVLASLWLPKRMSEREPWIVRWAGKVYAPVLEATMQRPYHVLVLALVALGGAIVVARGLDSEDVPRLSEGAIVVTMLHLPGISLEEANRANTMFERTLLAEFPDEIEHIWSRTGSGEVATDPMGVEESDIFIALKPREHWTRAETQAELMEKMEKAVKPLPGQGVSFSQPIEQRVNEMVSGTRAHVAIKLFGNDFAVLQEKAEEIKKVLTSGGPDGAAIEGLEGDPKIDQLSGQPVLEIKINQDQIARYGVPAKSVLELIEAIGGRSVGEVIEVDHRHGVAITLPPYYRTNPQAVESLIVATVAGERIPLGRLAAVRVKEGPATIRREWGKRLISIQCNVKDRGLGNFVAEARRKVGDVPLPPGYRITWGGRFENLERANRRLAIVVPVALLLIFILLYFTYNNVADALRVFTGVPLACIGGVLALWVRDLPFSISAGVGFIALSGVSVLNSMVLVTFILHLRERGMKWEDAIESAALTRLRPVLMTALVASLGFLPMALSTGMGAEVQRPLATVVIGGVISSTLLTLVVLPALYLVTGKDLPRAWRRVRGKHA
jgi:cobalt-zinc-cadmium resistance protein CzcA